MPYMEDSEARINGLTSTEAMDALLEPKKLMLFFDGTGNTFSGSNADTNVVKLLNKLDRHAPRQFHYYQTGIGTYDINETSVNKSWFGEMKSSIAMTIDQGIGNTFDAHVMAGYRFLMKFYDTGAKIYMFGFSRGAFTAKFLARMVNTVGLLCKGNEEMVPFVYRLYQRYLAGEVEDFTNQQANCNDDEDHCESVNGDGANPILGEPGTCAHGRRYEMAHNEITAFSNTFCRKEQVTYMAGSHMVTEDRNIKVFFLGIWDCVNSVAPLERRTPVPVPVKGTAQYVRHAVAVDERRVKFKPALLSQDIRDSNDDEDLKEIWFPGCHGDVGGGWPAEAENPLDSNAESWTIWQSVKNLFTSRKPKEASKDVRADPFQMSDIPLAWMIHELELIGEKDKSAAVKFSKNLNGFKRAFESRKKQALTGPMHDSLAFGRGTGFFRVLLWKFMEVLPIITRWELEDKGWVNVRFPLNMGACRDIPRDAVLHESLLWRLKNDATYCPGNNHGGRLPPCLKHKGTIGTIKEASDAKANDQEAVATTSSKPENPDHQTYIFFNP
ncbi:putative sporulation associated protein [Rosellinia necatrix]|uniref:Putative sporulation associated protein n=1 Tax=Rosellinia necatrix TaxID=77044 RepID=A0A1W2TCA9_ROSNE|nr:putative sporulation associated protein [Rosellinia necatrix]